MSTIKVDNILKRTGTGTITLGQSGDTIALGSGASQTGFGLSQIETPYCARLSSGEFQSVANSTHTLFEFASGSGAETFDKGGIADKSNGRITIPSGGDGFYWLHAGVRVYDWRAARNILSLYKNGSDPGVGTSVVYERNYSGTTGTYQDVSGSWLVNASATDYFQIAFFHNNGSSQNMWQREFSAFYLGSAS
tara:strand:+ start:494 stop:1072 length:579 start_codon:yes stop_codon:yes gene_type:complete